MNRAVLVGILCPCGCGGPVKVGRKFSTSGCSNRGRRLNLTDSDRLLRSERMKEMRGRPEVVQALANSLGKKPWMAERNRRLDIRLKVSKNRRGKRAGEDHPFWGKSRPEHGKKISGPNNVNWRGGAGTKYPPDFSDALRRSVRRRDGNRCVECGAERTNRRELEVHHVDRNRDNNKELNLVTLCQRCHLKRHARRKVA
jgi:hypothetical protein